MNIEENNEQNENSKIFFNQYSSILDCSETGNEQSKFDDWTREIFWIKTIHLWKQRSE